MGYPSTLTRAPRLGRVIDRPRLLQAGMASTAVVICGPSGTGKTVLARQLADRSGDRTLWIRLAVGYAEASDLLGLAHVAVGRSVPQDLRSFTTDELASELLDLLEGEPTTLVIDDYSEAADNAISAFLAEVLSLLGPGSRVVVTGRPRPAGLIGRARSSIEIIEPEELAFDIEEAIALFATHDRGEKEAIDVQQANLGWAAAMALAAESSSGTTDAAPGRDHADASLAQALDALLLSELDDSDRRLLDALVALPFLTADTAEALGIGSQSSLDGLAGRTTLLSTDGTTWRLADAARRALAGRVDAATRLDVARASAPVLARYDATAAIDALLDAGDGEAAADLLAAHLSEIGPTRAVHWLYRLPAERRRRFPPLLAAGQATVNIDEAVNDALQRLEDAPDDARRREALLALGSAHAHAGNLGPAAEALEAASAPGGSDAVVARAGVWLGIVRWWAGDLIGARAVLSSLPPSTLGAWARAEVELASDAPDVAAVIANDALDAAAPLDEGDGDGYSPAMCVGVLARVSADLGEREEMVRLATEAYELAVSSPGFDLAASSPAYLWHLVNEGRAEEAHAIVDHLDRRFGRFDVFTRVQTALVKLGLAARSGDAGAVFKARQRMADYRRLGYPTIEAEATRRIDALRRQSDPGERRTGLRVDVLGPTRLSIDGTKISANWKSRKALEVLLYLAVCRSGTAGREQIIEAVWPERDPVKGRTLLRTALSEIRRQLEPSRPSGEPSSFLSTAADRVTLEVGTDLEIARELRREERFVDALQLFRGPFMVDEPYVEWADDLRPVVDSLRLELAERVAADEDQPSATRVAAHEVLVEVEPWNDDRWQSYEALFTIVGDDTGARELARRRDAAVRALE